LQEAITIECPFPAGFLWGAATSAYQIEGAVGADGRGESIWDRFVREPGRIDNGDTGDVACDHYHRWREDLQLMQRLGLRSYRFSVAWPRVMPTGKEPVNKAGLDFYDRLVDGLLAAGIVPLVTLYHWDLPAALQDRGGWTHRDTAYRFRDYAAAVFQRLGDRVERWLTVNEPYVAAILGHAFGVHAPGLKDPEAALRAAHHLLLAHGLAVEAFDDLGLRSPGRPGGPARIGLAVDIHAFAPASDREADRQAAVRAQTLEARWFLEPVFLGRYPALGLEWYDQMGVRPPVRDGDLALVSRPIDHLGVNYYRRHVVADDPSRPLFGYRHQVPPGRPVTELEWEVYPEGLYEVLTWVRDEYLTRPVALLITENGAAYPDVVQAARGEAGGELVHDGEVRIRDPQRRDYIALHLYQVWRALQDGLPVEGYWVWSLMDNFEWARGYRTRFGIVYVDFDTQARIIKDSGRWYAQVCRENRLAFDPERIRL